MPSVPGALGKEAAAAHAVRISRLRALRPGRLRRRLDPGAFYPSDDGSARPCCVGVRVKRSDERDGVGPRCPW